MADDIVTRLRNHANWLSTTEVGEICDKAADEITRLRAVVDWFVEDRIGDFHDDPVHGPMLEYDGMVWPSHCDGNLPADVVAAFREASCG